MNEQMRRLKVLSDATRHRIAEIRRQLEAGENFAHCVLDEPALANVYVRQVLGWQKGWGSVKVAACLGAMGAFNPKCSQVVSEEQRAIMSYYCSAKHSRSEMPPKPSNARKRHPSDLDE
jgi:hypothetical protein